MEINITQSAQEYLNTKNIGQRHVFLALDDGSSKYSKLGGSCSIGNKFQLVVADNEDADYAEPVENNAGLQLTTGHDEPTYLGEGLTLDYKMGLLSLRDNSGIIDNAVTVTNFVPQDDGDGKQLKKDMQELGNRIC
ncbi:iron-sulfur cluster biosynthesis family protein [Enterococcus faecalis]|uniref:iron-sulfur cluster biosynthesis family protein n=1 Tax=Enterococcus faecalis TaxID=1351 RepID=UPI0013E8AD3C|nr:iron-sulfur cluster biosynthesis family protein [Enterococcus faecalis]